MTTEQGNRLIAEFMNYPENGKLAKDPYYYAMKHCYDNDLMKYHEDWNWLMPVVEKIDSLAYDSHISHFLEIRGQKRQNRFVCRIEDHYYPNPAIEIQTESDTKISAAWQAVVKFIQWYNSNTQTTDNGQ